MLPTDSSSTQSVAQATGVSDVCKNERKIEGRTDLKRVIEIIRSSKSKQAPSGSSTLDVGDSTAQDRPQQTMENESTGPTECKDVTINVSDNPDPTELKSRVATLFNQIFTPEVAIEHSQVRVERMSAGTSNYVYMVEIDHTPVVVPSAAAAATATAEAVQLPRKILLRVYGAGSSNMLSRDEELYWVNQLSSLGLGIKVYVVFGNGRLEEFLESTTLTENDTCQPSISRLVAQNVCQLHSLVTHHRPYGHSAGAADGGKKVVPKPWLWAKVDEWMEQVQSKWSTVQQACKHNADCTAILNNWSELKQAVEKYRAYLENSRSPIVFAHNDVQYSNILQLEGTGELVLVDFEYSGYNYRGYDIANHYMSWATVYDPVVKALVMDLALYPTAEQRYTFLREYVLTKAYLDANIGDSSASKYEQDGGSGGLRLVRINEYRIDEEVEALDREVAFFEPAPYLHWGIWALLQACSSKIEYNYVNVAEARLAQFLALMANIE
ncbi:hypothetical protein IWW48_003543 [Coemansia sp. RSA 1200]|nr:hypothetical protein IWW48_003543 [Coemansia sp. RSA 1200]